MLDNTVVPLSTAAEVSSHDDSMAKIYSFIIIIRKDKNTNKKIIHSILIIITIIFALIASIYAVILDVNVQSMLARSAAGFLSNQLDTEVKIKTFYIKPDLRIHAEEIQINDRKHLPMFYVGEFDAKLSLRNITDEYRIKDVIIDDVLFNLVKYENEYQTNLAELFGFDDDKKEKKKFNAKMYLDRFNLTKGHLIVWNQNKDIPHKTSMDYSYLDIDSIYLTARNLFFNGDSIIGVMDYLSATDRCGFTLDEFSSNSPFLVSSKGLDFKNLIIKTHTTDLNLDLKFLYNGYDDYRKFVDSIMIIANIKPSQLTLSDLRYFSAKMGMMTDTLQIKGLITGTVRDFTASNFSFSFKDSTNFLGTIKMRGLPKFKDTHIVGNIEKFNFTYQDISEFAIPNHDGKIPLPKQITCVKEAMLSGEFYGFFNNFNTKFNLHTNIGNVFFNGALNNNLLLAPKPYYFLKAHANNVKLGEVLDLDDDLVATMMLEVSGEGLAKKDVDLEMSLDIEKLFALNKEFKDLYVVADMENQRIITSSNINSNILNAELNALLDVSKKEPSFDVKLDLKKADLYKLGLVKKDETMILSTKLNANLRGTDVDKMYGDIALNKTSLRDGRGYYIMDSLNLVLTENHFNSKNVKLDCDFFDLEINGIFNFRNIGNTFKNYVLNYFHINKWTEKGIRLNDENQDFYLSLNFKNTAPLSQFFLPNLKVSDNTVFTATFTSSNYKLHSTLESDLIMYNKFVFTDLYVKNKTDRNKTTANVSLKEIVFKEATEKNPVRLGLDNFAVHFDAHNDTLFMNLSWDDIAENDNNKGDLQATFLPHVGGGELRLLSTDVIINDTLWNLSENCRLDFNDKKIFFNEFDIYSKYQSVKVNGTYPKTIYDTLSVTFNNLDVSDFDILTSGIGLDIDGVIDGDLKISGIKDKFTLLSNLDVKNIGVNDHVIGNAFIDANWNEPDTSIHINTEIIRDDINKKLLIFEGDYYTSRKNNNLDFDLKMNDFDINPVNTFAKKVISKVEGKLDGDFKIMGSLKKPLIIGDASLNEAACKINYLNTYYKINPNEVRSNIEHYIRLTENKIEFHNLILVDTLNNRAVADGIITHDYLKKFNFDIDMYLDNFIGMNMTSDKNTSFYGSAIASGTVKINGPLNDISMDIDATTNQGTTIDIMLNSTASINDNFIVFVQKDNEQDTIKTIIPENKKDNKFTLKLNADISEDANVNIHLPSNMGNIAANGSGNIRLGLESNQLSLYGDYVINDGTFNFNFQNLVRRDFDLIKGGTITWTGKADEADINVVGRYKTKSSISSLGLEADTSSMVNNVRVDCILRLQEKLTNPTITFGLALPNATDDVKSKVFSVIDTTNQAVMSQQIISLLVLGSFSYTNSSLYSIGASNYYNVLTSSLSSWLSQISKDFDVGVRYTPEDNLTAEELDVALSTQLFDDRLTIEGNLGMYTDSRSDMTGNANNIVGDVDITYKITNRLSFKAYNHSNLNSNYYTYTYEAYSDYTQGIGFSYSQNFDKFRDIFVRNKKNKKNKSIKTLKR